MITLFWLALVLGGGLGLLSLMGGALGLEIDDDFGDADAWHILSMRSATYFLFAFGAVGLLTQASGASAIVSAAAGVLTGVAGAFASAALFRYAGRTTTADVPSDGSLVGLTGAVVLPLRRDGDGKIVVRRGGREIELLARPFAPGPDDPESWHEVVVVDVSAGTALVTPYSDLQQLPTPTE